MVDAGCRFPSEHVIVLLADDVASGADSLAKQPAFVVKATRVRIPPRLPQPNSELPDLAENRAGLCLKPRQPQNSRQVSSPDRAHKQSHRFTINLRKLVDSGAYVYRVAEKFCIKLIVQLHLGSKTHNSKSGNETAR